MNKWETMYFIVFIVGFFVTMNILSYNDTQVEIEKEKTKRAIITDSLQRVNPKPKY